MRDWPAPPAIRESRDGFRMNRSQFGIRLTNDRSPQARQDRGMHPYLVDVHNARLTGATIPTPLTA